MRDRRVGVAVVLGLGMLSCAVDSVDDSTRVQPLEIEEEGRVVSDKEADEHMIDRLSQRYGVSADVVREKLRFEDEFRLNQERLLANYPGLLSAAWMDPLPNIAGYVRFTADVPTDIELVGKHIEAINLLSNGVIPGEDHVRHIELAADAMTDAGHSNFSISYDVHSDSLVVEHQIPVGSEALNEDEVASLVRAEIIDFAGAGESGLRVIDPAILATVPVSLQVVEKDGPILEFTAAVARGGQRTQDLGGGEVCTSGFSAEKGTWEGILSAGHCLFTTKIKPPGYVLQNISLNYWHVYNGDSAFWNSSIPVDNKFFYTANFTRSCTSKWTGGALPWDGIGQSVCSYGRSSNDQKCGSIEVSGATVNLTGTYWGTVTVKKLTRVDYAGHIGGDSGGPVYQSGKAMGNITGGSSSLKMHFTPVAVSEAELGISVLTN